MTAPEHTDMNAYHKQLIERGAAFAQAQGVKGVIETYWPSIEVDNLLDGIV